MRQGDPAHERLKTATLNPARFFEATDSLGTVAPRKGESRCSRGYVAACLDEHSFLQVWSLPALVGSGAPYLRVSLRDATDGPRLTSAVFSFGG